MALLAAGCGEDRDVETVPPEGPTRALPDLEIIGTEYALDPSEPSVRKGSPLEIELVNQGDEPHQLAIEGPKGTRRTKVADPGGRASVRLSLPPGTYKLSCPLFDHAQKGMVARLRVGGG